MHRVSCEWPREPQLPRYQRRDAFAGSYALLCRSPVAVATRWQRSHDANPSHARETASAPVCAAACQPLLLKKLVRQHPGPVRTEAVRVPRGAAQVPCGACLLILSDLVDCLVLCLVVSRAENARRFERHERAARCAHAHMRTPCEQRRSLATHAASPLLCTAPDVARACILRSHMCAGKCQ